MNTQKSSMKNFGSFNNWMMANNSTEPEVGGGATILSYTDRHPYEVLDVFPYNKTCKIRAMKHKADKSQDNIMGHQNWILESDESMPIDTLYFRHGAWKKEIRTIVYDENFTNGKDWKDIWNLSKELGLYDENGNLKHVEGYTKVIREWQKVNIIFGFAEYHFDWEF